MRKTTLTTHITHEWFSIQILVNYEIFKPSLNLSLTHLIAQTACHELKGNVSPVILNKIFHGKGRSVLHVQFVFLLIRSIILEAIFIGVPV